MKTALHALPTLAALIALTFSHARAATDVWNGGTNDWNTGTNWSAGVPNSTVTGSFSGSANPNVTLSSTGTISGITFNTSTDYTIGTTSGPAIILTNGAVTSTASTDAAVQTINAPLIIGTGSVTTYIFQSNSSTAADVFNIGGSITGANAAGSTGISFAGSNTGTNTVSGVISDGNASNLTSLTFNSATSNNIWYLTAANTYSGGATTGGFGTLMVGNNFALGSGTLTLTGSGVIQGDGAAHTLGNAVFVNTSGIIGGKSNLTFTGATTFAGTGGTLTVNNTGSTTLAGNVYLSNASGTGGSASIFAGPSANLAVNGTISDFNGSGTAGALNITAGTGSNITISGSNTYGSGKTTTINTGNGSVVINNNSAFGSSAVSLASGATIASGANSTSIGNNVTLAGNANFTGSNNLAVTGTTGFTANNSNFANESTATVTLGNVNLSTTGSSAITTNLVGPGSTTISGVIADGTAAKSSLGWGSTGTLTLSGHTTSTGAWNFQAGTVVLNDASDSGVKVGTGTLGLGGTNLQVAGNGTSTMTLTAVNYDLAGQVNISRTGSGSEAINLGTISTGFTGGTNFITAVNYQSGIATTTSTTTLNNSGSGGIYGGYATVGTVGAADYAMSTGSTGTGTIVAYNDYQTLTTGNSTFALNYVVTNSLTTTQNSFNTLKIATTTSATQTLTLTNNASFSVNGGILDSAQGNYVMNGAGITLSSIATSFQQYGAGTMEIDNQILGTSGLYVQKAGPGDLILTGNNAWRATLYINSGTLTVSSDANLGGESSSVVVASSSSTGTVVTLASAAPSTLVIGSSFLGSTVSSIAGTTVNLAADANQTISSNTSVAYAIAAGINLDGGTLEATSSFALSETGATTLNRTITLGGDGGTFQVDGTNTLTAPGAISNLSSAAPGFLTKTGTGKLILSSANSYSGGTYIDQGTIQMGIASALGTASLTNGVTINGGTLDIDGFSPSLGNLVLQGGGSIINSGSSAAALNAYSYNFQSGSVSATLADNSSGATAMTKSTTGTVTLNNGSTYSGGTTVVGGKLVLANGSVGSATGSGLLSVTSTGTISGIGTSAAANFNIAGTVIAGSGLATDTTGQTTITGATQLHNSSLANATLEFNIATNSRNSTTLNVGSTGVDFASTNFSLTLVGTNFISAYTPYVLVAGVNTGALGGVDGSQYTGFTTDASGADGLLAGQYKILSGLNLSFTNGNGSYANSFLFLNTVGGVDDIEVDVVPEPSTWALMFGGLVILLAYQRRKQNRQELAK